MDKQMNLNINPDDLDNVKCECGSWLFMPLYQVKIVPGIMVGSPKDMVVPQDSGDMACAQCGKPLTRTIKEQQEKKEHQADHGIII